MTGQRELFCHNCGTTRLADSLPATDKYMCNQCGFIVKCDECSQAWIENHQCTVVDDGNDWYVARCRRDAQLLWPEILAARVAAHHKHGQNSIERLRADSPEWLPILVEEVGEVANALTYDDDSVALRGELIDVLAVASAWLSALDDA